MKRDRLLSSKQKLLLIGFIKYPHEGCYFIAMESVKIVKTSFEVCEDLCPFYSGTCDAFDSMRFERNDTRRNMAIDRLNKECGESFLFEQLL